MHRTVILTLRKFDISKLQELIQVCETGVDGNLSSIKIQQIKTVR